MGYVGEVSELFFFGYVGKVSEIFLFGSCFAALLGGAVLEHL